MSLIPWKSKQRKEENDIVQRPAAGLRDEIDRLFDRFMKNPFGAGWMDGLAGDEILGPRVDLAESENDLTVTAELPGIDPKDVEISVSGNVLTIRGEKKQEKEQKQQDYHYIERQFGSFQRSVQLPTSVDPDKIDAVSKNGTLTVTLAKHPEAKPKRITVKSD